MSDKKITVTVDEDLEELIPGFLENRKKDIDKITALIDESDYHAICRLGHSVKGVGGGYGFDEISVIGEKIETAAKAEDAEKIMSLAREYQVYLENIEIIYE